MIDPGHLQVSKIYIAVQMSDGTIQSTDLATDRNLTDDGVQHRVDDHKMELRNGVWVKLVKHEISWTEREFTRDS